MSRAAFRPVWRQHPSITARQTRPAIRLNSFTAACASGRRSSTLASLPAKSSLRVTSVFTALILLGIGSTAYGLYEFYSMFTVWPKEVRGDLRTGIKAKNQGDLGMSEQFLNRALETAQTLPIEVFGSEPHLKLSGIAIALAGVLEDNNKPRESYELYARALDELRKTQGLSGKERLRAVAVAYKLGEMADTYQQPSVEEERWLVYAVEELLRVLKDEHHASRLRIGAVADVDNDKEHQLVVSDLELPKWVELTDVVAPLQALGAFYNRAGKQEYAVPLYLSALNFLMPSGSKQTSAENRCRGADVMNGLADSLLLGSPTPERRTQAEAWVKKAIAVIDDTRNNNRQDPEGTAHCELVLAAALFNLGSMREMAGDIGSARNSYVESRKQSSLLKQRDGVIQADMAIRRLDRLSKSKANSDNDK